MLFVSRLKERVKAAPALQPFVREIQARKLAVRAKRLDLCAAQVAKMLHLAGVKSIEGKTCVEIGSGLVLTHSFAMHLLGAKRVIATDVARLASVPALVRGCREAMEGVVRDVLGPFQKDVVIRLRLAELMSSPPRSMDDLKRFGIEYVAPLDLTRGRVEKADVIFSTSVLEHVPGSDLPAVLGSLAESLNEGGIMLHTVHLEDHLDLRGAPFAFLAESAEAFYGSESARGNRVRFSEWKRILSSIPGVDAEILYVQTRDEATLPAKVDPSIRYDDERDLRTSHFGVALRRSPAASRT